MKKYLGIIKIYENYMSGTNITLLTKTYDDKETMNIWFNMYPNREYVLLENTPELDSMFEIFNDMTPITEEEKHEMEDANQLYLKLLKDE